MSLAGRRVLVTGGTGFIGSAVVKRLAAAKAEIHLLVRKTSSPDRLGRLWDKVSRHIGDLGDAASLAACARKSRADFVIHLAKDREGSSFEKEAAATLRLAAVLHLELPRLVRWVRTAHSVRERFGPGADAELCAVIARKGAPPLVTLELFSVYGPGQEPGDFPSSVIREALAGRAPSDAEASWKDFVYVEDVAQAYELAALAPGVEGRAFQIGSGVLSSEAAVAALARRLIGGKKAVSRRPAGQPSGHPADISAARESLRWTPRTSLDDGVRQTIKSWRDRGHDGF